MFVLKGLIHPVESSNVPAKGRDIGTHRNGLNIISVKQTQEQRSGSVWNKLVITCE